MFYRLLFVCLVILIGCGGDNFTFKPRTGERFSLDDLEYVSKVMAHRNGYIILLKAPHKTEPFMSKKYLVFCDNQFIIKKYESFNDFVLTERNDTLICYTTTNNRKEKHQSNNIQIRYLNEEIQGQNIISNTMAYDYLLTKDSIRLKCKRSSSDLYINYKCENISIVDSVYQLKYDISEVVKIRLSDCFFDVEGNEIYTVQFIDNKEVINRIRFVKNIMVKQILNSFIVS